MTIDLSLTRLFPRRNPAVTCGISVVGYRFLGKSGQVFQYAGETFKVGNDGYVELLADRREKYFVYEGVRIRLQQGARDAFGFVDVDLPAPRKKN